MKDLFKVMKYIELLKFTGSDEDLFASISEDKVFKFKFTEIERLLSQRAVIASNVEKPTDTQDEVAEEETVSSFSSFFGLNSQ